MVDRIRITDVGPRDGLQNEDAPIPTDRKAALVRAIADSGVDEVEITSFVSPKWVPQLGDAAALCDLVAPDRPEGVMFSALVPNERGMDGLLEANQRAREATGQDVIAKASVFTAASETFTKRNINATIDESLARFVPVIERAHDAGLTLRAYVSCAIACPFEGPIDPGAVADVSRRLLELGADEIDLGDTIGAATPESTARLVERMLERLDTPILDRLTLHLHDTFGRAADCVRTALEMGVRSFDGAAGGLGGCPFASTPGKRAPGNLSTLSLVDAIAREGRETRVNRDRLVAASELAERVIAEARAEEQA